MLGCTIEDLCNCSFSACNGLEERNGSMIGVEGTAAMGFSRIV